MEATASIGCQSRELSLLRLRRCSDGHTAYEWVMAMGEAESASAAAPACSSACSVEKDDDAPRTRTYLDESEAVFDRLTGAEHLVTHIDDGGGAAAWDESQRGQRELRFRLAHHPQRTACACRRGVKRCSAAYCRSSSATYTPTASGDK